MDVKDLARIVIFPAVQADGLRLILLHPHQAEAFGYAQKEFQRCRFKAGKQVVLIYPTVAGVLRRLDALHDIAAVAKNILVGVASRQAPYHAVVVSSRLRSEDAEIALHIDTDFDTMQGAGRACNLVYLQGEGVGVCPVLKEKVFATAVFIHALNKCVRSGYGCGRLQEVLHLVMVVFAGEHISWACANDIVLVVIRHRLNGRAVAYRLPCKPPVRIEVAVICAACHPYLHRQRYFQVGVGRISSHINIIPCYRQTAACRSEVALCGSACEVEGVCPECAVVADVFRFLVHIQLRKENICPLVVGV